MEVIYSNEISNYFSNTNISGFVGEIADLKVLLSQLKDITLKSKYKVKHYLGKKNEYLSNLGLKDDILLKKINQLSSYEYCCVLLLKVIKINPKIIILNYFDLVVCEKYKSKLANFIRLINASLNINFLIISNNYVFINNLTKHLIIMNNKVVKYQGNVIGAIKSGIIEKPEIISFIDSANEKGAKLDYYLDNKELLKAIYRSVF